MNSNKIVLKICFSAIFFLLAGCGNPNDFDAQQAALNAALNVGQGSQLDENENAFDTEIDEVLPEIRRKLETVCTDADFYQLPQNQYLCSNLDSILVPKLKKQICGLLSLNGFLDLSRLESICE